MIRYILLAVFSAFFLFNTDFVQRKIDRGFGIQIPANYSRVSMDVKCVNRLIVDGL